jgi:hypothetical protein
MHRLSVVESMIRFKGRSSMPKKPVKRGYKVWCLGDSTTGFITKFQIYTGKVLDAKAEYGLGERVVMDLCQPLINSKCLVAFDNFFTSDKLMRMLLNDGIYSIGTVRTDRKELPNMLKTKEKLSRGEFMFSVKGAVAATKWQDSKPVTIISTAANPKTTKLISRKNKDGSKSKVYCPEAVEIYNSIMGRRSTKWWHRIFYYLLDLAIVNAYTIMNVVKKRGRSVDFSPSLC